MESVLSLSKYLAQAGVASRRKVVDLIKEGSITVNGKKVTNPAAKIHSTDSIIYNHKLVVLEKKIYILLNKPKDYITTVSDEKGRKTVMDLLEKKFPMRLYPVGRLDRMTTGLLLLTNDGDLAQRLAHPSHEISKVYHVHLDHLLSTADFEKIQKGLILKDGGITVDDIRFIPQRSHNEVVVRLHSGKNRIVRRIFEHLGYQVKKLDRIEYAGLNKKGLLSGKWRYLTDYEIKQLNKDSEPQKNQ